MTKYEKLISEYENDLVIVEALMRSDGLYSDGCVWVNSKLTEDAKCCVLAEEIGHYMTSSGDILNQKNLNNQKQEFRARKWAYEKMLPPEAIYAALGYGCREAWEIAEYLGIDEGFVKDALKYYGVLDVA